MHALVRDRFFYFENDSAVLRPLFAIQNKTTRLAVEAVTHQFNLHHILYLLYFDFVLFRKLPEPFFYVFDKPGQRFLRTLFFDTCKGGTYHALYFRDVISLFRSVSLNDIFEIHFVLCCVS